jgi:hypothetical protein
MLPSPERGNLKSEEGEFNGKENDQALEEVHEARSNKASGPSVNIDPPVCLNNERTPLYELLLH